ncbi:hypothetical protein SAMN02800694_3077 [Luteibacter sp. UNCMF331Sha3.1]|uniref:hypothetical protein n=1 Tax=Luteibacter sp. UNCMF331Sha3.1 TaxID=1502760 RepID=UPI0008AB7229|nr:hypothetical protein [Luteibacter sp. UNCMF331Sha3.1]SEN20072.1 hypothetical protein SAMN02800694_3077 [Luteibacter sp. UNCMF331Sha3.1]
MPSLEVALMTHAGLVMDASAVDAATLDGDFDEARALAADIARAAKDSGHVVIAAAAEELATALAQPAPRTPVVFDPYLARLADALDDADPRRSSGW